MSTVITAIRSRIITVSEKTKWTFIEVTTTDGLSGIGEATAFGREEELAEAARHIGQILKGRTESEIDRLVLETRWSGFVERAVVSAVEQASWDIKGKRADKPVHALLGIQHNRRVPIYANINRRTLDRSSAGIAKSAEEAVARGYRAIKIAPFDGLSPHMDKEGHALFHAGIERIEAVRDAVGPNADVMVDCHWRLSFMQTTELLRKARDLGLYWVECPLSEAPEDVAKLQRLKPLKDETGIRFAGAERGTNADYFERLMAAGVYDVIMPDVKYTGGLLSMAHIAEQAAKRNLWISPHNPSGPVCHLASLHLAAVVPNLLMLEHQFDESPLFLGLCPNAVPAIKNGTSALPSGPGIGFELN